MMQSNSLSLVVHRARLPWPVPEVLSPQLDLVSVCRGGLLRPQGGLHVACNLALHCRVC